MGFEVWPPDVAAAGQQVGLLGTTVPSARTYVTANLTLGAEGGKVYRDIRTAIDRWRGELEHSYAPSADFQQWLVQAGRALEAIAADYRGIDQQSRAGFDALVPATSGRGTSGLDDHAEGADPETAGVVPAEVTGLLQPPATGFEGYEVWREIAGFGTKVLSLDWVWDLVSLIGRTAGLPWPDLSERVQDVFDGDWEACGRAASTLNNLNAFFAKIEHEMAASAKQVDTTWSGNAADAAFASFNVFEDAVDAHQQDLLSAYGVLHNYALGMRYLTDSLADVVGMLADEVLKIDPKELLLMLAEEPVKALLARIELYVDLAVLLIDACFSLVAVFALTVGQLDRDSSVVVPDGSISRFQRPDVNGPGR